MKSPPAESQTFVGKVKRREGRGNVKTSKRQKIKIGTIAFGLSISFDVSTFRRFDVSTFRRFDVLTF